MSNKKKNGVKKGSEQAQDYLDRTQRLVDARNTTFFRDGMQNALDIASLALREEFGFGPERLKRFVIRFQTVFTDVQKDNLKDKEDKDRWYSEHIFETRMQEAWGPYYQSREVRYGED